MKSADKWSRPIESINLEYDHRIIDRIVHLFIRTWKQDSCKLKRLISEIFLLGLSVHDNS